MVAAAVSAAWAGIYSCRSSHHHLLLAARHRDSHAPVGKITLPRREATESPAGTQLMLRSEVRGKTSCRGFSPDSNRNRDRPGQSARNLAVPASRLMD
jgi:hypothetical protein